uniref:PI-PLC Y-box domain-containing protein n=1 Tax=Otus sunia TaxID=257818 RepID=A0A8C8AFA5_9STRI
MFMGYVDGNVFSRYDSDTRMAVPRADWVKGAVDPQFWERNTQIGKSNQQNNRVSLDILRGRYNQSGSECGLGQAPWGKRAPP